MSTATSDAHGIVADDEAATSNLLQSPPRLLSGKTSSPQGVMDFHSNVQEQGGDDVMHKPVVLFPMNSPQRPEVQQISTATSTMTTAFPLSSLEQKESIFTDEQDEAATSFLPRGLQQGSPNKVKDIYRPNEKKDETRMHGFADMTKQNSLRNKQREDGLTATNVNDIRKMFNKRAESGPMGLEAFNQQQAFRRQQEHKQKIEALAKMHGFSEEVIAAYLKKSAHGEIDYSHLAKLQDEIDKLKNTGNNDIPVGMGRLEKSPHRKTRRCSGGEIDTSHVVDVDGVDRSDWQGGPLAATTALSADAVDIHHADFRATDYRGMIFVVHHQEGLMLLRGVDKDISTTGRADFCDESGASTAGNVTGAGDTSVPRASSNVVAVELHESDALANTLTDTNVGLAATDTPLYQLPGGRIRDDDALAAAQQSSNNPQRQLLLAARAGAARQLYESTGIDVRSRLTDLVPALLKPDCDDDNAESASAPQLPNEHHGNIFFFLNVTDDDFVRSGEMEAASIGGVERQGDKEEQPAMDSLKAATSVERLLLKLSNEHSSFMFEKEPTRATELLKSDHTNLGVLSSEALELLTQQQKTLTSKTTVRDAASRLDESSLTTTPFTLDRFWQRQYHPSFDYSSISAASYRSLADAKDAVSSDDAAHASENEEMGSTCQESGLTGATTAATAAAATAASSPSTAVDEELQKSMNKCACCIVM
jgi:hypothetical protein